MWPQGSADTVCPRLLPTLTFDRLTLKLVWKLHLRWETFLPNLGMPLHSGNMHATDGQTDGRTKATLIAPFPMVGGIIMTKENNV